MNPKTVVTDLAKRSMLINTNEEKLMHIEDLAKLSVAQIN